MKRTGKAIPAILLVLAAAASARAAQDPWVWKNPRPTGENLNGVSFPTVSIGYAVGASGTILKTTDGGATWTAQTSSMGKHLTVEMLDGYADGHPRGRTRRKADAHLRRCPTCPAELERVEQVGRRLARYAGAVAVPAMWTRIEEALEGRTR